MYLGVKMQQEYTDEIFKGYIATAKVNLKYLELKIRTIRLRLRYSK